MTSSPPDVGLLPRIVSYDVWDTILRRRCDPNAVKVHAARDLLMRLGSAVRPHLRDPWILFHLRQSVEREIGAESQSRGLDDEYALHDVLIRLLDRAAGPGTSMDAALVDDLMRAEIEHEKRVVFADPLIEARIRADDAQRRIFVSDFYLGKQVICELLDHVGLGAHFHDGYVSCEAGFNKRSGRLFGYVMQRERIEAAQLAHHGDNAHSDVKMPQALGIQATHYQPAEEHARRESREKRFRNRSAPSAPMNADQLRAFAAGTAPLFIGFALFVSEQILARGLPEAYFLTREGSFFLALYRILREHSPYRARLPEGRLLEVSRISTFGPSLASLEPAELMRLWNLYSVQTPRAFLKSLDLAGDSFASVFERHGLPLDAPVQYPWTNAAFQAALADPAFAAPASALLGARRELFLDYCAQHGLDANRGSCAIVDIGWRGTIQDNIACMLPQVRFDGCYLGLSQLLNAQPVNAAKSAFGPDHRRDPPEIARRMLQFVAPMEMLANAPEGSVVGYERRDGMVIARRLRDEREDAVYESFTRRFQEHVLDQAREWSAWIGDDAVSAAEFRVAALATWNDIIRNPNLGLAKAYFSLSHNETFGVGRFVEKSDRLDRLWPLRLLFSKAYRKQFRHRLSLLGWTEGYARVRGDTLLLKVTSRYFRE